MDKYLTQKINPSAETLEKLKKQEEFSRGLEKLKNAPVEMVDDFKNPITKDLPVDRINTRGEANKIVSAPDFKAQQIINEAQSLGRKNDIPLPDNTYDAGAMKSEYEQMKKSQSGRKVFGTSAPVDLDYNSFRKSGLKKIASGAKSILGPLAIGLAGYTALQSPDASAAALDAVIPGGLDSAGPAKGTFDDRMEQGQLTDEDKQQLMLQQAKIKALQGMRK